MERDCAESQSQQHHELAITSNLLRLVLRTQPRSWLTAKFTDNLWMHWILQMMRNWLLEAALPRFRGWICSR